MSHHRCDSCGDSEYLGSSNIEPLHHVTIDLCGGVFTELCEECRRDLAKGVEDLCLSLKQSNAPKKIKFDYLLKEKLGADGN